MSSGPILIFDKSLLESLSVDECVWLAQFYRANVTPMFFIETIADLQKEVAEGRTPEGVVARLALKTAAMTADANAHHVRICTANLLGNVVDMHGVPMVEGGQSVASDGKKGLVFDVSPETKMVNRWQNRKFDESEREAARNWRRALEELDLDATYAAFRPVIERAGKPRDLFGVKTLAETMLNDPALAEQMLGVTLMSLGVPTERWGDIFNRWTASGRPVLPGFAPYAAYCATVDLFFSLAIASGLISKDRPSNKADLAYLYYLPFCMVFTSGDKLHRATAPLFMQQGKAFVWGQDMKADLKALDEHYSTLPEETRAQGIWSFAHRPPLEGAFLVTSLWDKFLRPIWRQNAEPKPARTTEEEREFIRKMREMADGPRVAGDVHVQDADFVVMKRPMPVQVGKWRIMPPGAEDWDKQKPQ
jgi:hypothetical protein